MSEGILASSSTVVSSSTFAPTTALAVPTKRRRSLSPDSAARQALRVRLSACSAADDFPAALEAIAALRATAVMPPPHAYNLLLNIASRARTIETVVLKSALSVFADMVSRRVALSEASYASIIRICALAGEPDQGSGLLEQMKAGGLTPRLRSYAALVKAYAVTANVTQVRALFADMARANITPSQAEHASLLLALEKAHHGPQVAIEHVKAIAEDQPIFDEELAAALEATLHKSGGEWATTRVRINRATGICPVTGRTLRAIDVSPAQIAELSLQTAALAGDSPDVAARVGAFRAWLAARPDFDVLIDGPNVGFFGQNFESGALMYSQIEAVRAHFAAEGRRVLIVIGEKWLGTRSFSDATMRRTMKKKNNFYAARSRGETVAYTSRFVSSSGKSGGGGGGGGLDATSAAVQPTSTTTDATFSGSQVWCAPGGEEEEAEAEEEEEEEEEEYEADEGGSYEEIDGEGGSGSSSIGNSSSGGGGGQLTTTGAAVPPSGFGYTLDDGLTVSIDVSNIVAPDAVTDSQYAGKLIAKWKATDSVYGVPRGFNDDWFWMMAAFSTRTPERVLLCSNDFMRDHHYQMVHSKSFAVWRERHQVRFAFCEATDGGGGGGPPTRTT